MRTTIALLVLLCFVQGGFGSEKRRSQLASKKNKTPWQMGILVEDSQYPRRCLLEDDDCRREFFDGQQLVIETDDFYLTVQHVLVRRPLLTLHGSISFVWEKSSVYIRDERARVFEFKLVQKALK